MSYAHLLDGKHPITLDALDANDNGGVNRKEGEELLERITGELVALQELMYAAGTHSLLVVLQGRDTSGKDGAIRKVFGPLDSQSCSVASFKVPTEEELAHDFLWRVHPETPAKGHIRIFNRSHYEDVLVARVHRLVPESVWRTRYEHINAFEKLLADSSTIVLKLYLHISRDEQERRLLEREKDPTKAWKLSVGDWKEREHWDEYTAAYQDALNVCSRPHAPWLVVPADRKWYRNLAVAEAVRDALEPYRAQWLDRLEEMSHAGRRELEEYRTTSR